MIFARVGTPTEETWPGCMTLPYFSPRFPVHRGSGLDQCPCLAASMGPLRSCQAALQCNPDKRPTSETLLATDFFLDTLSEIPSPLRSRSRRSFSDTSIQ